MTQLNQSTKRKKLIIGEKIVKLKQSTCSFLISLAMQFMMTGKIELDEESATILALILRSYWYEHPDQRERLIQTILPH